MTATATPIDYKAVHRSRQRKRLAGMTSCEIDDERQERANDIALMSAALADKDFSIDSAEQLRGGIEYELLHVRDLDEEVARRERLVAFGYIDIPGEPLDNRDARFEEARQVDCEDVMRALTGEWGRSAGDRAYFRCPLHDDSTASLVTYPSGRGWHCFGCGAGGDAVGLIAAVNAIGMGSALELLESGALGVGGGF